MYRFGPTRGGPWMDETLLIPGWAHEFWTGIDGSTYTSYLTDYSVTINSVNFDDRYSPPKLFIGDQFMELFLPQIILK